MNRALTIALTALVTSAPACALAQTGLAQSGHAQSGGAGHDADATEADPSAVATRAGARLDPVWIDRDEADEGGAHDDDVERVDAVDADDLTRRGATTVGDALDGVAGAALLDDTATNAGVSVDGLPTTWTRMLIDGAPSGSTTNTRSGPVQDLRARPIDPATIERIEIHRGVGPAGTAGESGILVNIVTRPPEDLAVTARAGAGFGHDTWTRRFANVAAEAPLGDNAGVRPSVFVEQREAIDVDGDLNPDTTRSTVAGGTAELQWRGSATDRLRIRADVSGRDQLNLGGPDAPFDDRQNALTWDATIAGRWGLAGTAGIEHTSTVGVHAYDLVRDVRDGGRRTISDTSHLRVRNDLVVRVGPPRNESHVEVWADHARVERTGASGEVPPRSMHTVGVGGGHAWTSRDDAWSASTRAIVDLSDAFGPGAAGEVSSARRFGDAWTVRASGARTRRLPSAEELYLFFDHADVGYAVEGQPDLGPEFAWTGRAGAVISPDDRFSVEFEGFVHRLDDAIDTVATGDTANGVPVFSYGNTGRARILGTNAGIRATFVPSALDFEASWAWVPVAESLADEPLNLRAEHRARAELRWFAVRDVLELWADVSGRTAQTVPTGADPAPGFARFDVGAAVTPTDGLTIFAEAINLTDQTHPSWGPAPGRAGLVTLEWTTR